MNNIHAKYLNSERALAVLPAFAELSSPILDERISETETHILKNGCYSPIIVNEGKVVTEQSGAHTNLSAILPTGFKMDTLKF